ncbi:hypothetical protein Tco_0366640 [Tanacetum coccineum]
MAALKFASSHNMVKTVNEEVQIQTLVDKKNVIITETSVRSDLQLEDAEVLRLLLGTNLVALWPQLSSVLPQTKNSTFPMFLNKQVEGMARHKKIYVTPSHTKKVFANIKRQGKDFSGRDTPLFPTMIVQEQEGEEPMADETENVESVPTHSNDLLLSGEDRLKLNELMELCTNLSQRFIALETTKTNQALEIDSLKRRVKKLEKKKGSRTHRLRRLFKVGRSAQVVSSKDKEVTLVDEAHGRNDDNLMFDTGVLDEQEVEVEKTLIEIKATQPKAVTTAATTTTTAITRPKARGVVVQEPSKDKGKEKMVEPEKPLKKKYQILIDEEIAQRLQEELQAELEEEERLERQKEKDANIVEWDNVQAMIYADYELAVRLQAQEQEELTIEGRSKMFMELMDKRKNHFARLRAEEQRRKPPTKAQKRKLESDNSKKQKLDESVKVEVDDEAEMKKHTEIVSDDEVAIDAIPLATKPPLIVDWKIIKERKIGYFQIIRADGSSRRPEEAYERVLWGDLKVMFEPDIESDVWRNLQGHKVTKKYPLTPATITAMLNKKLQVDHWNEMCYQLLKLMTKQGRIVGIKRLHDDLGVNTAKVRVTTASIYYYCQWKLRLLRDLEEILLINVAGIKVNVAGYNC